MITFQAIEAAWYLKASAEFRAVRLWLEARAAFRSAKTAQSKAETAPERAERAVQRAQARAVRARERAQEALTLAEEADALSEPLYEAATAMADSIAKTFKTDQEQAEAAAEALALTAEALIAAVERRTGSVIPAEVRERITSASAATLNGWLSDIVLRDSLESLFAACQIDKQSAAPTPAKAPDDQPDAPDSGQKKPQE